MDEAVEFLGSFEKKEREKIIYNIYKAKVTQDQEVFKKLSDDIWKFRTLFNKTHFRLFAFWDKTEPVEKLVVSTHGIIKKTKKTPPKEIQKAVQIKEKYFNLKTRSNEK
ncbi:MAG: type II toxin-antitoxin system RelE/ParE family toxin [Bacteroidales bacterium]|nr:type II toxin-antitoxin system RelE/ParE family toxin [Bacteroidales bacterium]